MEPTITNAFIAVVAALLELLALSLALASAGYGDWARGTWWLGLAIYLSTVAISLRQLANGMSLFSKQKKAAE